MKKLLISLVLIMLIISFFQITSMYALYREQLYGEYSSLLGAWEIKVNGTDITTSGQTEEFTISDGQLEYITSDYIQAGKIAPDGQAYFDIVIDPSNTDVSIVYQVDVGATATGSNGEPGSIANIQLVSASNNFKLDPTDEDETATTNEQADFMDGNSYTGIIHIDDILQGYKNCVRLQLKWVNVEANNATDEALAITETPTISVPVQINLKQYTGEVIDNAT